MTKKYLLASLLISTLLLGGCLNKKPTTSTQQTQQAEQANTGEQAQPQTQQQNRNQNQIQNEFWDLTPFIKSNLTTWEKEQLLNLLDQRSLIKSEINNLDSYEWDKIIKLREIKQKREQLKQQLLSYVDPKKAWEFNNYCNQLWEKVQNKYTEQYQKQNLQVPGYSQQEVARHNKPGEDCRTIINWAVYDITPWFQAHPWGADALNPLCWTDWTQLFMQKHGSNPKVMAKLEYFRIGIVKN